MTGLRLGTVVVADEPRWMHRKQCRIKQRPTATVARNYICQSGMGWLHLGRQKQEREIAIMAYVITDTCTKDELCVEACPTDCIHPKKDEDGFEAATQLYVDPEGCIDCGACVPVCPTNSIFIVDEVPEDKQEFIAKNAEHYATA
jgi:ferredoxin